MREESEKSSVTMAVTLSDVERAGDNDVWFSPITNHTLIVDGKIKSRHTANSILKRAGIDYKF